MSSVESKTVQRLIESYLSERMTEAEAERWLELCRDSGGLPGELFEHLVLDEMIRDLSRGGHSNAVLAKAVAEVIERRDLNWLRRHPFLSSGAALLIVLGTLSLFWFTSLIQRQAPPPLTAIRNIVVSPPIAFLQDAVRPVWEEDEKRINIFSVGEQLFADTLRLRSGLLKIRFQNGATILLEGPAELRLISPVRVACLSGRLSAVVPPEAAGFRVDVHGTSVIDLGTVFMIDATKEQCEIQVQKGRVALTERNLKNAVVEQGSALRYTSENTPRHYHADSSFARKIETMVEAEPGRFQELYAAEIRRRNNRPRVLLPKCTVIAQRGLIGNSIRENTVEAFQEAIRCGADACELDVARRSDGQLVTVHPTRTLTDRETAPLLDEILEFFRNESCYVVIDVFAEGTEEAVVDAIDRSGLAGRVLLTGRYPERVKRLKQIRPDLCVGLCCDINRFPPPFDRQVEKIVRAAESVQADFVKLEREILSKKLIECCRDEGLPVWFYTIDKKEDMNELLRNGAVGVLTGRCDLLKESTEKMFPAPDNLRTEEESVPESQRD